MRGNRDVSGGERIDGDASSSNNPSREFLWSGSWGTSRGAPAGHPETGQFLPEYKQRICPRQAVRTTLRLRSGADGVRADGPTHYRRGGDVWAQWAFDGRRLVVENCPFGFRPLFWREYRDAISVSDSVLALIDERPALNVAALAVFVRLGFFIGDDTAFLGVRQLPPNSKLTWTSEGTRLHIGELPRAHEVRIDRAVAMKRYDALLREVVAGRITRDFHVPLSGGRDSRHIALAIHTAGARPTAFVTHKHLPWRADEDVRIAAVLSRALGVPHIVIEQPKMFVRNILRSHVDSELLADEGGQTLPFRNWLNTHARCIFDGIAGDVMSAGLFQIDDIHQDYVRGRLDDVVTKILRVWEPITGGGWSPLIDQALAGQLSAETARKRLRKEIERHADNHNPQRSFYFWNRTRREIAITPFLLLKLEVEAPYLDMKLWHFLESLPWDVICDQTFHTKTVLSAYPEFAHIPFEDKDAARPKRLRESICFATDFLRTVPGSIGMKRSRLLRRSLAMMVDHDVWWSPTMALYLRQLLRLRPSF